MDNSIIMPYWWSEVFETWNRLLQNEISELFQSFRLSATTTECACIEPIAGSDVSNAYRIQLLVRTHTTARASGRARSVVKKLSGWAGAHILVGKRTEIGCCWISTSGQTSRSQTSINHSSRTEYFWRCTWTISYYVAYLLTLSIIRWLRFKSPIWNNIEMELILVCCVKKWNNGWKLK